VSTRSMTGYGRGERSEEGLRATVELRSVNHRFLDIQVKAPREWMALEPVLGGLVRERLGRGRVELFVRRQLQGARRAEVQVDLELAEGIRAEAARMAAHLGLPDDLATAQLVSMPGVLQTREPEADVSEESPLVEGALADALDALVVMRQDEGGRLAADVRGRLDRIEELSGQVEERSAEVPAAIKARVERRVAELLTGSGLEPDPDRLAQEAAILGDKAAVDEELTRLASHLVQARQLLDDDEPVGRRLEFLVQELHREVNTIGSKSAETTISRLVVELKSTVEKIREQVANIE
jgi:uncharacterized protein (TIGR00255 family)